MPFVKPSCSLSGTKEFLHPPSCPKTIPFKVITQKAKEAREKRLPLSWGEFRWPGNWSGELAEWAGVLYKTFPFGLGGSYMTGKEKLLNTPVLFYSNTHGHMLIGSLLRKWGSVLLFLLYPSDIRPLAYPSLSHRLNY